MAKLILNTLPARNCVTAFVADPSGEPKLGLAASNFRLSRSVEGSDGSALHITRVTSSPLRGFYFLDMTSKGPRRGNYIFELVVENGEDRGETLASVAIG